MVLPYPALEKFAEQILTALRMDEPKAKLVAHSLVASNLRAVDSHGVQLLPFYVDQIEHGLRGCGGHRVSTESGDGQSLEAVRDFRRGSAKIHRNR